MLVTGVLGCLGAWVARELLGSGAEVIGFDLGGDTHRLDALVDARARDGLTLVRGDVSDDAAVADALIRLDITHVIHLAALQIPACRANPAAGARVNVLGTVNVLEAVRAHGDRIAGVVYASSVAVYGPHDLGGRDESPRPATHYGAYKLANEATARVAYAEHGLRSVALRPSVVFGAGRDQGMTSSLTEAIAAASRGERFEIPFGGTFQVDYARDVARAFVALARDLPDGAVVHNFPGQTVAIEEFVAAIDAALAGRGGLITWRDEPLPFPPVLESELVVERTPLRDAVLETAASFGD